MTTLELESMAPNQEAKLTAKQARTCVCEVHELMVENDWSRAKDELLAAIVLLDHLIKIEARMAR